MKEFSIPESRRSRVGSRRDGIIERNGKPGKTHRFRSNKFVETNRSNRIPSTTVDYVTRATFIRISIARFWQQVLNLIRYRRVFSFDRLSSAFLQTFLARLSYVSEPRYEYQRHSFLPAARPNPIIEAKEKTNGNNVHSLIRLRLLNREKQIHRHLPAEELFPPYQRGIRDSCRG